MSSRIFISSVQKEFETERAALAEFIKGDPLLSKQFETFVFERDLPASDQRPDKAYLARYIERYGTGTGDMIRLCREAGLPEPEFQLTDGFLAIIQRATKNQAVAKPGLSRDQAGTKQGLSRDQVKVLKKCLTPSRIKDLMKLVNRSNRTKFRDQVLKPLLIDEWVEMTLPDKPTSSQQKCRITEKGQKLLESLEK